MEERRIAAWIGKSIVIEGTLVSSEDLTIAGRVDGDVAAADHVLVIAAGARIRGNVAAQAVVVQGDVLGSVTGAQRVEVGETGVVRGDIRAPRMVVAEGAVLDGRVAIGAPARGA